MRHERFEWDLRKASTNLAMHGVRFEDAARILADPFADRFHLEEFDDAHSTEQEDRWITTASHPGRRSVVLVTCWTPRIDAAGEPVTRIISARAATRAERIAYEAQTS